MWRCSDRQGYRLLGINFLLRNMGSPADKPALSKEAHKEWLDAFNDEDINQRDLLSSASDAWSARRGRRKNQQLGLCDRRGSADESNDGSGADRAGFRGHRPNGHYYRR